MGSLFSLLALLAPGFSGGLFYLLFLQKIPDAGTGLRALLFSTGVYYGYLTLALIIRLLDSTGHQAISPHLLQCCLILFFVSSTFVLVRLYAKADFRTPNRSIKSLGQALRRASDVFWGNSPLWYALFVAIWSVVLAAIYAVSLIPVMSWDGLGLWTGWGGWFVDFHTTEAGVLGRTRAEYESFPFTHPRHPMTIVHLAAVNGFALQGGEIFRGWLVIWSVIWLAGAAAVWGFVRELSNNHVFAMLACFGYVTMPLLENHAVLLGYPDLWVTVGTTLAAGLMAVGLWRCNASLMALAGITAISITLLKNTGTLYAVALTLPAFFAMTMKKWPLGTVILSFFLLSSFGLVLSVGFDIELMGVRFAFASGEPASVIFGGYEMSYVLYPLEDIIANEIHALIVNQSFSLLLLIWLLSMGLFWLGRDGMTARDEVSFGYLLFASVAILLVFMLPQVVTQYATRFAAPESDLGNSRFTLAFGPLTLLTIGFWARAFEDA